MVKSDTLTTQFLPSLILISLYIFDFIRKKLNEKTFVHTERESLREI